ncbi:MAG: S1C family serine protease, partial [Dongiaceae bacterium]
DWTVAPGERPRAEDYAFDLDRALAAMVSLRSTIPEDAFTAEVLGTERSGNGVLIRKDGIVLTIGYLIVEAEQVWLTLSDGRTVAGHVLAYDPESGFGLVQALARLDLPVLELGDAAATDVGTQVVVGGAGGRQRSVAAHIAVKQEFAGYWEYLLDEAIFTVPSHPQWGGSALIGPMGDLLGIGSLQLQRESKGERREDLNMIVPVDLLKPIYDDLLALGRPNRPARPWLGLYATEIEERVVVAGLAGHGPAKAAKLRMGDIVLGIAGDEVHGLADLWRKVWGLGQAGVEVPLTVHRDGRLVEARIVSADRNQFLKAPRMH